MSSTRPEQHGEWYKIRIQGRLDDRWSTRLDDFDLSHTTDGTTVQRGPVADQAALHGLRTSCANSGCHCSRSRAPNRTEPSTSGTTNTTLTAYPRRIR